MKILVILAGMIAIVFIIALIASLPLMLLWNWLMPEIFGLKTITWLQAFGLSMMAGILFGSHRNKSD